MSNRVPPRRESELVPWLTNLHTRLVDQTGHFGVPEGIVTSFTSAFNTFIAKYDTAKDPETRTKAAIQGKDTAKTAVVRQARHIMGILQSMPTVSDEQRVLLGFEPRDVVPTPVNPPALAPLIIILSVIGRVIRCQLKNAQNTDRRAVPFGVEGATIFSYVGETPPPAGDPRWKWEGQTGKPITEVEFPPTVESPKVWLTAVWYTKRGLLSPATFPVSALLQLDPAQQTGS